MRKKRITTISLILIFGIGLSIYISSRKPKFYDDKVGIIYVDKSEQDQECKNICEGKKRKLNCKRKEIEGNVIQWFFADYEECTYLCLGEFSTSNGKSIPCEEQLDYVEEM